MAYFWEPQTRDKRRGCPVHAEALGTDYGVAVERARLLNQHLDAWRHGQGGTKHAIERRGHGTVAWLFDTYQRSAGWEKKVSPRSRYEYKRALARIEDVTTTIGGTVADLPVASISPAAADKIYAALQNGPRGKRIRQANLSIDVARRAWKVVRRLHPGVIPSENPWTGVLRDTTSAAKPACTREEAYQLANMLRTIGEPHLGAAALICFEWHQRPEHVRKGDITWADYRPPHRPDAVQIRHPKTGVKGWVPLEDDFGPLFPELEAYLVGLPRLGLPIVLTAGRRGPIPPSMPSARCARRGPRLTSDTMLLLMHAATGDLLNWVMPAPQSSRAWPRACTRRLKHSAST